MEKSTKFKHNVKLWNYEIDAIAIIGFLICIIFFVANTVLYSLMRIIHRS